jgi:hypothetical protein
MQYGTHRSMRTHRHSPTVGPFSGRSKKSERKLSRPAGVRFIDAKKKLRTLFGARTRRRAGDAIEIENYYQHAEHYFRLMKEQAAQAPYGLLPAAPV